MHACDWARKKTNPFTSCASGRIAGWSEHVKPLKEKSLVWHRIWDNCGRPRSGAVADCMRRTQAAYHYTIRNSKKNEERMQQKRFAQSMLKNDKSQYLHRSYEN